ncbi:MAG: hypothetical protein AAGC56_00755 [Pseudomonadota bacterium]
MTGWTRFWIGRATWPLAIVAVVALGAFTAAFIAGPETAWGRALAGGGGQLPEAQAGFPTGEPARSLEALRAADAMAGYVRFQAIDVGFTILNVVACTSAIALFLRKCGVAGGAAALLLLSPLLYCAAELIENALLAGFATTTLGATDALVRVQQTTTTVKLISFAAAALSAVVSLLGALVIDAVRMVRRGA